MTDSPTPAERIAAIASDAGLTIEATFVPFSLSRNAKARDGADKPWQSLNWRIVLRNGGGRVILETDYAQGVAHCPAYDPKRKWASHAIYKARAIAMEIETGRMATAPIGIGALEPRQGARPIDAPPMVDVLSSLALDSSAIDHACFEDWADDYGYSTDSRSAESTYRQCLSHALALRAALGEERMSDLREAAGEF